MRPRPDLPNVSERTYIEDTYPEIFRLSVGSKALVDSIYIESLDSTDAVQLEYNKRMVAFRNPDIVIYTIGINDCAPRVFSKNSRSIVFNPTFRKLTRDCALLLVHKYRSTIIRVFGNKTYVDPLAFRSNLLTMIDEVKCFNSQCIFFALPVFLVPARLDDRSVFYNSNISAYNNILKDVFDANFLALSDYACLNKISDGIHLTKQAHKHISDSLLSSLLPYITSQS